MRNLLNNTKHPAENITILPPCAFSGNDTAIGEGATTSTNTTIQLFSPPGTDLRMDWGDACNLGCLPDINRYFLLVMDKGNEYFMFCPTKTRASPLALLKQFVILTGRKICYSRIDGAKEFQSDEIKEFCAENDVVLQLVVAYNHTMQARVQGAVGCIKQHSRMLWLHATSPPVSGMTRPKISASRKYTFGLPQTPAASSRHLTIACSQLSSALTTRLPYLSDAESSLNCLVSTAWSRTDHLVIVYCRHIPL